MIEDGPTLTHGGVCFGAGTLVAKKYGAAEIVDPRPYAVGTIEDTFEQYEHLDNVLPAMGYGVKQIQDLEETVNNLDVDLIISGILIDLAKVIKVEMQISRTQYMLQEIGSPTLEDLLDNFIDQHLR